MANRAISSSIKASAVGQSRASKRQLTEFALQQTHNTYPSIADFKHKYPELFAADPYKQAAWRVIEHDHAALMRLRRRELIKECADRWARRQRLNTLSERAILEIEKQDRKRFDSERQRNNAKQPRRRNSMRKAIREFYESTGNLEYKNLKPYLEKRGFSFEKNVLQSTISQVARGLGKSRRKLYKAG